MEREERIAALNLLDEQFGLSKSLAEIREKVLGGRGEIKIQHRDLKQSAKMRQLDVNLLWDDHHYDMPSVGSLESRFVILGAEPSRVINHRSGNCIRLVATADGKLVKIFGGVHAVINEERLRLKEREDDGYSSAISFYGSGVDVLRRILDDHRDLFLVNDGVALIGEQPPEVAQTLVSEMLTEKLPKAYKRSSFKLTSLPYKLRGTKEEQEIYWR